MTEQELINHRLFVTTEIHSTVLRILLKTVAATVHLPTLLQETETKLLSELSRRFVPGVDPAMSDLLASEFQEAAQKFFAGLKDSEKNRPT